MQKIILVIFLFMGLVAYSHASSIPDFPFILVSGDSEINEKPDTASMTIYLTSFNKDSSVASREINEASEYIAQSAKDLNIPVEGITFKTISKSVTRNRNKEYQDLEILGYEMSREVNVSFSSLENFTEFSDKMASKDNVERVETEFGSSKELEINKALVKKACENAKNKASLLAQGLDVKLGSVFAVTQDTEFSDISAVFLIKERVFMKRGSSSFNYSSSEKKIELQIVPKSISFKKTVNVVYKISE